MGVVMMTHRTQVALNVVLFVVGAYLFWHFGRVEFRVATLQNYLLTLLGAFLMTAIGFIFSEPCHRHTKKSAHRQAA